MNNIESSVKPSFFDQRIADFDSHYYSRFSRLCAHLIKTSGKEANLREMSSLYTEIAEMKKVFDEDLIALKQAIVRRHGHPASFYNLKCFRKRTNRLWWLMNNSKDLLMNAPKTQEDVVAEFITILNGEYAEFLSNKSKTDADIEGALRELTGELTELYQASLVTGKIG